MQLLLKNIIRENVENRINLTKVNAILEKVLPEMKKAESEKITEMFSELALVVEEMNQMPYTMFNMEEWRMKVMATYFKVNQLKEEILKVCEGKEEVITPLISALDEVFIK